MIYQSPEYWAEVEKMRKVLGYQQNSDKESDDA